MTFLSDHALAVGAAVALALALLVWWGDRRRQQRSDLDRVGLMPWSGLFFWSVLTAAILCAGAVELWLAAR